MTDILLAALSCPTFDAIPLALVIFLCAFSGRGAVTALTSLGRFLRTRSKVRAIVLQQVNVYSL